MIPDWEGVATAINARLSDRGMKQQELAERSGVSVAALRLLQKAKATNARPRTLAAVSEALGWPREHLAAVRDGRAPSDGAVHREPTMAELAAAMEDLRERVAELERVVGEGSSERSA
ncbi:helix-turn-helix domain-containing protein [Actinosynnema sp. NPDC000082]|uniref:helix-turn-helix domain-containing protein n=1 Tax=Actinosynnema sp. NPDC000082 TaxID=3363910 RepID=UPI00337906C5|nr:DNA-binding transcriptional regulator, XRE family [Actinosynnema pretiosum]